MLWQDTIDEADFVVPKDVLDLSFRIECRELPIDHALALSTAIGTVLPWLEGESQAGIHSIHVAASGNGWMRPPEESGNLLQLSKRTRFYLRIPNWRSQDASALCGSTLDVDGFPLNIGKFQEKLLIPTKTIFSRSVCCDNNEDEETFTNRIVEDLKKQGIAITKLLCGLEHTIKTKGGCLTARSVLLADLELPQSIHIQQHGIGPERTLGCGIFLPHKSLAAVGMSQDED